MQPCGPNSEQITYWNEKLAPKWVGHQETLDRMIRPFGERAMAALEPRVGGRVLDVGCGCGDTSLELARRLTPSGSVLGVDVSAPMLVRARERAAAAGLAHVRFLAADAQTHRFAPESFDGVYSRFGVMFFADPIAAFANLRAALAPGGRLAFVCWQPLQANPWMLVPLMAVAGLVPVPPPPPPEAPGPFAFGDRDRVVHILRSAGLGDLTVEPFETELVVAGGSELDRTVEFVLEVGPTAAALREVEAATLARVRVAVRDALAPYTTPRGVVMPSAAWVVSTGA